MEWSVTEDSSLGGAAAGSADFSAGFDSFSCAGEFEGELIAAGSEDAAKGSAVVGDPIGAGSEESGVGAGGADGEDTGTGAFAGARAGGGVFDGDAVGGRELQGRGALQIRFGMRFAVLDVAGSDQVMDE